MKEEENELLIGSTKGCRQRARRANLEARSLSVEYPWLLYDSLAKCYPGAMLGVEQITLKVVSLLPQTPKASFRQGIWIHSDCGTADQKSEQ